MTDAVCTPTRPSAAISVKAIIPNGLMQKENQQQWHRFYGRSSGDSREIIRDNQTNDDDRECHYVLP